MVIKRVILICSRDGQIPPFIPPTHVGDAYHQNPIFEDLKKWVTFEEAVEGLEKCTHGRFPESRLRFYRMLGPGEYWKDLPENLHLEALGNAFYSEGGRTGFYRRIAWAKPSPTLVTSPVQKATDLAHPVEDRPLSIEEYARIQQFPDNWKFSGNLTNQYKQIGNAVPVGLGKIIGQHIINFDNGTLLADESEKQTRYSRYNNTTHHYYLNLMS